MGAKENQVESYLHKRVVAAGGMTYKWVSPNMVGVPDRIVIMPGGRVYFVEVKSMDGKLAPHQIRRLAELDALGVNVRALFGTEEVDKFVEKIC